MAETGASPEEEVETDETPRDAAEAGGQPTPRKPSVPTRCCLSRGVQPEDVANAVLWLASDEARYVTGVAIPVEGGMLAKF